MKSVKIPNHSTYPLDLTENCAPGGDGQCDGWEYDEGDNPTHVACECPCHEEDCGQTVAEIAAWHRLYISREV